MKIAIIFCSKHGTVKKIAGMISEKLNGHALNIIDLDKTANPRLNDFDVIIIGGSIYYGKIQKKIKMFCEKNSTLLLSKKTALFISYLAKEMEAQQFNNAFPEALRKNSFAHGLLGGELIYGKLGLIEKLAVRFAKKVTTDVHELNFEAIDKFSETIKKELDVNEQPADSCLIG